MPFRWFTRGDLDGFFGLALDNLVQLLMIDGLCRGVLQFPAELVHSRILPGAALSLLVGNLLYAWQARRLALRTGRADVCALPYGINTVSLLAHIFLVMLPAKLAATAAGVADPAEAAWRVGLVACLGSGVVELAGTLFADRVRRATPLAAMLSTLAGVSLGFIALGFLFRTYAHPVVGLTTLGVVLLVYFGRVRFRFGLPGGFVAVVLGTLIAWLPHWLGWPAEVAFGPRPPFAVTLALPTLWYRELWHELARPGWLAYLGVIVPMGVFNLIGSLQNIASAEAAGDSYPTAPSLAINGIGSVVAAACGSCFPTTIYIGHPGWKAMGARAGYSALNGLFFTVVCLLGLLAPLAWLIPIDAGMAIVLWIGIVIAAQAFDATERRHAPAVVVGLLPGIGAWGALMAKVALRAGGVPMGPELFPAFERAGDVWLHGALALEQGFIFTSMVLSATTVALIDRRFRVAAAWCLVGSLLSLSGLIHGYRFLPGDTAGQLNAAYWELWVAVRAGPDWAELRPLLWACGNGWAAGYALTAGLFAFAPVLTEPGEAH